MLALALGAVAVASAAAIGTTVLHGARQRAALCNELNRATYCGAYTARPCLRGVLVAAVHNPRPVLVRVTLAGMYAPPQSVSATPCPRVAALYAHVAASKAAA